MSWQIIERNNHSQFVYDDHYEHNNKDYGNEVGLGDYEGFENDDSDIIYGTAIVVMLTRDKTKYEKHEYDVDAGDYYLIIGRCRCCCKTLCHHTVEDFYY